MSMGLKRGMDRLEPHDPAWDAAAEHIIATLWNVLGPDALDIQHVGSTSISGVVAKPIVDIAVLVPQVEDMRRHDSGLAKQGVLFRKQELGGQLLYVMGEGEIRTHHIHVLSLGDPAWRDYILFRDYLRVHAEQAVQYSNLKMELATRFSNNRESYTLGKSALIKRLLELARAWDSAGRR